MNSPTPRDWLASENWPDALSADDLSRLTPAERLEWDALARPTARPLTDYADDPLGLARDCWPAVRFYDRQEELILSVRDNDETFVPAGHKLGKDFASAFVALWFFLTRAPCRVITTSVKDDHLRVLWGEIARFLDTSARPLLTRDGGPLLVNHREIRRAGCRVSYLIGTVSEKGEGMAGHHAPHTLLVVDEASGVADVVYERADTWARRKLIIGNPYPCNNFFYRGVKAGDLIAP
jgi:phage terminase large subunit